MAGKNIEAPILAALRASPNGVNATDLARQLHVTGAVLRAHIDGLRALGYEIVPSPHHGYRLLGQPDLLHPEDLVARAAGNKVVGRAIRVFARTTSTNDLIARLGRDGEGEGYVIFAESQTKGRGRMGRTWVSPPGRNLLFSVLLRPAFEAQAATRLTIAAATALARAVKAQTGVDCQIKWPNDVLIQGRKLAGILTEVDGEIDRIRYAILGIGVNVNIASEELPPELRDKATSLQIALGRKIHRGDFASRILAELDRDYARVLNGHFDAVAEEWGKRCVTLGQAVVIKAGSREVRGRAESLDNEGALLVRTGFGHLERVVGGEVQLGH